VLVTILGTLKQTQTLDDILPSMLQMEQQIRADERETVPIYGAKGSRWLSRHAISPLLGQQLLLGAH